MTRKKMIEKLGKIRDALQIEEWDAEERQQEQENKSRWEPAFEPPPRAPEVEGTAGLPAVFMDNPHELYLTLQGRTGKVTHITAHPPTAYPGDCKVVKFIRVDESVYHGTQIEEQEKEQV